MISLFRFKEALTFLDIPIKCPQNKTRIAKLFICVVVFIINDFVVLDFSYTSKT